MSREKTVIGNQANRLEADRKTQEMNMETAD
jgi:hypothetical protein